MQNLTTLDIKRKHDGFEAIASIATRRALEVSRVD